MRKVAVFGNAGGGKSTLARQLAQLTQLPLYPLDTIQYRQVVRERPPRRGDATREVPMAHCIVSARIASENAGTSAGLP